MEHHAKCIASYYPCILIIASAADHFGGGGDENNDFDDDDDLTRVLLQCLSAMNKKFLQFLILGRVLF